MIARLIHACIANRVLVLAISLYQIGHTVFGLLER